MASTRSAFLSLLFEVETTPGAAAPVTTKPSTAQIAVDTRWQDGDASGQVNRVYSAAISLSGAPETLALDLSDASLSDIFAATISGDELKGLALVVDTGTITIKGGATEPITCFTGAGEGITLTAGQWVGLGLGAAGIDIGTTNGKLALTDGGAVATGRLIAVTSQ